MSNPLERGVQKLFAGKGAVLSPALSLESSAGWSRMDGGSTEAAMKNSAVNACVSIIANSIAMLPAFVMDEAVKRRLDDHPLGHLLWERPNPIMTPMTYRQLTMTQVLLSGNAYVWIYRNRIGEPLELIPLPPGSCSPQYDADRDLWWYQAVEPGTGRPVRLDTADVLHYKNHSLDGVTGVSVLTNARRTIETAHLMEQTQYSMYKRGGRPSGVLTVDTDVGGVVDWINEKGEKVQINRKDVIRAEWERYNSGADNAFRTAILDNGLRYSPISMSNADAQFLENRNLTVEDIARFFLTPLHKLGLGKQSYDSNEQQNLDFAMQTIQPRVTAIEQEDSYKLLTISQRKANQRIRLNMAAILRADMKARAESQRIYREMGVLSVNDVRELEDLPPVAGGDTRLASLNFVPLDQFEKLSVARNAPGGEAE